MRRQIGHLIVIVLFGISPLIAAEVITIAGTGKAEYSGDGGPALQAGLDNPFGIEIAPDGNLYFCDYTNQVVRRIDAKTGTISTVAGIGRQAGYSGDGGSATKALFHEPHELRFDSQGNYYVSDMKSHVIRRIDGKSGIISTVAGTGNPGFSGDGGPAINCQLDLPIAVSLDGDSGLLICDIKNNRVRRVDFAQGTIATFAGTGVAAATPDGGLRLDSPLRGPRSMAVEANQDLILVLREGNAVYRLKRSTNTLHHLAGTGAKGYAGDGTDARNALFSGPKGVAVDRDGNILLCDTENHVVRILYKSTGIIDTLVGDGKVGNGPDGNPRQCRLNRPHGIFVGQDAAIYIGDSGNNKIRKLVH